jgi:Fur family ferric uptake transcriptional regulator
MHWEDRLVEAGHRLTAPRRAVVQVLTATTTPLSPQEVWLRGQSLQPALGLASVYRTLDLLEDSGLVRRVHLEDGCHGYMPASPGHQHAIICRVCGQAAEFLGCEDLEGLIARVQQETGYRVQDHLLQLVGVCPECQGHTPQAGREIYWRDPL